MNKFDLLTTVEYGGCSCKLPAKELQKALAGLPGTPHPNLLVNADSHDDAGVFKINDEVALIQTTDFFSPLCSDPYEFGQIAAANALSDVYAMGGEVLTVLNIAAFPANTPLSALQEILKGGIDKVKESGGVVAGGHTIVNDVPIYGLAVTGTVHPKKIITNAAASPGDVLILTKPTGAGVVLAAHRIGQTDDANLQIVFNSMKQLNREGSVLMQKYGITCATDVTGFGLAGHALKVAMASHVTLHIDSAKVPFFTGTLEQIESGCIPGACFRNLEFTDGHCSFGANLDFNHKILMHDAQTSGGLLICCHQALVADLLAELKTAGYSASAVIGHVISASQTSLVIE